jgi:predicted  nucleic acid-binding Zn-ribbon protein
MATGFDNPNGPRAEEGRMAEMSGPRKRVLNKDLDLRITELEGKVAGFAEEIAKLAEQIAKLDERVTKIANLVAQSSLRA